MLTYPGLLYQTELWQPIAGPPLEIVQMSCNYKNNVHNFLLRHREHFYRLCVRNLVDPLSGEISQEARDSLTDQELGTLLASGGSEEWFGELPLVVEMKRQARSFKYNGPIA